MFSDRSMFLSRTIHLDAPHFTKNVCEGSHSSFEIEDCMTNSAFARIQS